MRNNRTKGNTVSWIQLSLYLREDPRIERLIEVEKMRGFGLYISIITRLYSKKCRALPLNQCLNIKEKGCAKGIVKRVIFDYGLFDIDPMDHVSSSIDFLGGNDATGNATHDTTHDIPTPAHAYYKNKKENKKNDYHHSKKSDDAADDVAPKLMKEEKAKEEQIKQQQEEPQPSIYRSEPMEPVVMDPIQYLRSLPIHSAWAEAMLQTLGGTNPALRNLVMSQWEETKDFLALHMESQDKASRLLSEHDVKRYFTNCLNNATVARKLQDHLAALRAKEIERQQEEMRRRMEEE